MLTVDFTLLIIVKSLNFSRAERTSVGIIKEFGVYYVSNIFLVETGDLVSISSYIILAFTFLRCLLRMDAIGSAVMGRQGCRR